MAYNDSYMKETEMAREDKTQGDDRTKSYGDFDTMAMTIQCIKRVMKESSNWDSMPGYQKESLEMMATKIGRLLCGDPYDQDTWYDIVGYAKLSHDLVEKELANANSGKKTKERIKICAICGKENTNRGATLCEEFRCGGTLIPSRDK